MRKGYVLLREFIYGLDFTEFDEDENIVIHETPDLVQAEIDWENEVRTENGDEVENDLSIAPAYIDESNHVVATTDEGKEIVRSEKPIS
jgi:hypothetical protein